MNKIDVIALLALGAVFGVLSLKKQVGSQRNKAYKHGYKKGFKDGQNDTNDKNLFDYKG